MNLHFIAIGGSAMHSLAIAMDRLGHKVSGSDDSIFEPSKSNLKNAGLLPSSLGWFPNKINLEIDIVILGMHSKKDNPELLKAQNIGLNIQSYPEFLSEISKAFSRSLPPAFEILLYSLSLRWYSKLKGSLAASFAKSIIMSITDAICS